MREPEAKKNATGAQPDHLLDELESIKDLLDGEFDLFSAGNTPQLGDPMIELSPPPLLDIDSIFADDNAATLIETTHRQSPKPNFQFPKFTLDVTICDDFLPTESTCPLPVPTIEQQATANDPRARLIEQLVEEFVPQITAALRARLHRLDDDALLNLKDTL